MSITNIPIDVFKVRDIVFETLLRRLFIEFIERQFCIFKFGDFFHRTGLLLHILRDINNNRSGPSRFGYMKSFRVQRNFRVELTGLWVNSNHRDHFNMPHTHSPDFFSGVWYLRVPEHSGGICFMNPVHANTYNYHNFFADDCFQDSATYYCRDNDLIMFPSYVEHLVMPNESDEERISVAFNFNLAP